MNIYKGSVLKMNPFLPQMVHPDDYQKFPEPKPERVIWATDALPQAQIHASFHGITSYKVSSYNDKPGITVETDRPIKFEKPKEPIYIYIFDSNTEGWHYLPDSGEWYSTKPQIPVEVKEFTRETLLDEIKSNPEITIMESQEMENFPIS